MNLMALAAEVPATPSAMESFLSNVGTFFTKCIGWLGTCLDTITGNPALTVLCLAMPICGFAVGLLGRLIRVN